jgi:hypothetical protein
MPMILDVQQQIVVLQGQLAEARAARHQLMIGKAAASVSYDGKSVSYSRSNVGDLDSYIAFLCRQIAELQGTAVRRGPVHLTF